MKLSEKSLLKRKQEIENRIAKHEREISILERELRETVNHLDLNKVKSDGQTT